MNIAFCIDDNFAAPLSASLHSLVRGCSRPQSLHIFVVGNISPSNQHRLSRVAKAAASLQFISPNTDLLEGLPTTTNISISAYLRLLLPKILPKSVKKYIYLDADVIVKGDILPLWETDTRSKPVHAVRDAEVFEVSSLNGIKNHKKLKMNPKSPYFNSGVLVVNKEIWNEIKITEKLLDYARVFKEDIIYHDQDCLNAVLHDQWGILSERWNIQTALVDDRSVLLKEKKKYIDKTKSLVKNFLEGNCIIHFTQGRKPWHPLCNHPLRRYFYDHFRNSGFFNKQYQYSYWLIKNSIKWVFKKLS